MSKYACYNNKTPPLYYDEYWQMNDTEAKLFFKQYINDLPLRMTNFCQKCACGLNIPTVKLDYSPESLVLVWKWLCENSKFNKTNKKELEKLKHMSKIFGETFINPFEFTPETKSMIFDIAVYTGQCFINNYPKLKWIYRTAPNNSITKYQPVISGMTMTYKGKIGEVDFPSIHIIGVQAGKIFTQEHKYDDLYKVYEFWKRYTESNSI